MDDATRERILDKRIQARLSTDAAYRNAANAEEQAEREDAITHEEEQAMGWCEECGTFGVDPNYTGADGRSVCDDCRDELADEA